jgi:uncharacterized membrane protein
MPVAVVEPSQIQDNIAQCVQARAPEHLPLRIDLRPNCSLTPESARWFVGSLAAITLGIAGFFTLRGFWPILPFAGLEVGLLVWAVRTSMRAGHEAQTITIGEDSVVVESRHNKRFSRLVFPRHWARVKLLAPRARQHPSRLVIELHGRRCEVGRFLNEDERRALAARLGRLVGRINESPTLTP